MTVKAVLQCVTRPEGEAPVYVRLYQGGSKAIGQTGFSKGSENRQVSEGIAQEIA